MVPEIKHPRHFHLTHICIKDVIFYQVCGLFLTCLYVFLFLE